MLRPTPPRLSRLSTIGWIGLGAMGHPMALNLFIKTYLAHHHSSIDYTSADQEAPRFVICEQDDAKVSSFLDNLRDRGGSEFAQRVERLDSGRDVAIHASRILTMLPSTPQVESVYLNQQTGILAGLCALPPDTAGLNLKAVLQGVEQVSSTTTVSPGPTEPPTPSPPLDTSTTISPGPSFGAPSSPASGLDLPSSSPSSFDPSTAPGESTGTGSGSAPTSPHTLLIDCTTLSPTSSLTVAQTIQTTSPRTMMLDAPVSGGTGAAAKAELTIMFGSPSPQATEMGMPLLKTMAREGGVVNCGGSGKGVGVKVCNNLILAINQIALAEGLALGKSLGIDPALLHNVINTSSGASWSSRVNSPLAEVPGSPGERGYSGGFQTRLMLKDAGLALQAASDLDLPIPMTWAAKSIYEAVCAEEGQDWASRDFSVVYEWLKKKQAQGVERGWKADPTAT